MGFNIENAAKQIAVLAPKTQAKLFASLAKLTGQSDLKMLQPEAKTDLEINTRYKVLVEKPMATFPEIKNRALRRIAARAIPMGIRDFAGTT